MPAPVIKYKKTPIKKCRKMASTILGRVLRHCTVINIKGEFYRLKEQKEFMWQKQYIANTLFEQRQVSFDIHSCPRNLHIFVRRFLTITNRR